MLQTLCVPLQHISRSSSNTSEIISQKISRKARPTPIIMTTGKNNTPKKQKTPSVSLRISHENPNIPAMIVVMNIPTKTNMSRMRNINKTRK